MRARKPLLGFVTVFTLALIVLVGTLVLVQPGASAAFDEAKPCCFDNDQYHGICKVYPSEGETCGDILAYLNNPMASGKTYCGNTQVRGGWRQVECN